MITTEVPNVNPRGMYPVGKACDALGIHQNTLRRYTFSGKIKVVSREDGTGRILYTGAEILRFWKSKINT